MFSVMGEMNSVSLVCTEHEERGPASALELHSILTQIEPDVIFLEIPASAFRDYYETGQRQSLESSAVRRYLATHRPELIPVDIPTPKLEFFERHEQFHNKISDLSPDYRRLLRWNASYVQTYGFAYLNSDACCDLWSEIYSAIHNASSKLEEPGLVAAGEEWNQLNEVREAKMLESILNYCTEHTFHRGVFLVGAAHRQGIIAKSKQHGEAGSVHWDYTPTWLTGSKCVR